MEPQRREIEEHGRGERGDRREREQVPLRNVERERLARGYRREPHPDGVERRHHAEEDRAVLVGHQAGQHDRRNGEGEPPSRAEQKPAKIVDRRNSLDEGEDGRSDGIQERADDHTQIERERLEELIGETHAPQGAEGAGKKDVSDDGLVSPERLDVEGQGEEDAICGRHAQAPEVYEQAQNAIPRRGCGHRDTPRRFSFSCGGPVEKSGSEWRKLCNARYRIDSTTWLA